MRRRTSGKLGDEGPVVKPGGFLEQRLEGRTHAHLIGGTGPVATFSRFFRRTPWPCRKAFRPRVAHTLPFMHAPHEPGQHLCYRFPSMACSGLFTVAPRWIWAPAADCLCSYCRNDIPAWREALRRVPGVKKNDAKADKVLHVARCVGGCAFSHAATRGSGRSRLNSEGTLVSSR